MNKKIILLAAGLCLFLGAVYFFLTQEMGLSEMNDNTLIALLAKNYDVKEYMDANPGFKIAEKNILTGDMISAGQKGQNFNEVYQDLALEQNRYMRVDLINGSGDKGLITVIDFKTKTVVKAFGTVLVHTVPQ